jgi:uncharacterized repeat protein (TIGR03837 family)
MSALPRPSPGPEQARALAGERWDIFCHVVDNLGDIGTCWRLACDLAQRGRSVRLFVDDACALAWMAPQGCAGVQVVPVDGLGCEGAGVAGEGGGLAGYEPADFLVAAYGCRPPVEVLDALHAAGRSGARPVPWIHLEYLSAEPYAALSHGLESPVLGGAAAGVHRWFYFPGFTAATGGLLREPGLLERRRAFDRAAWLAGRGVAWSGEPVVSLFCYEPAGLGALLEQLARAPARLLVAHGRSATALEQALEVRPEVRRAMQAARQIAVMPPLEQAEFDHLLWASDLNFVRGEDSLTRALWAGAGLVWQAYEQDDGAHHAKLRAFLDWLRPPESLERTMLSWNGAAGEGLPPLLASMVQDAWGAAVERARDALLAQDDLVTRLLRFVAGKR